MKLVFAANRDHFRKLQPIKTQSSRAQCQQIHLQNTPAQKYMGILWKRGGNILKARGSGSFVWDVSPRYVVNYTDKVSQAWLSPNMSSTMMTPVNKQCTTGGDQPTKLFSSTQESTDRWRNLGKWDGFPREEYTSWFSNAKYLVLEIYTQGKFCGFNKLYLGIHTHVYTYIMYMYV